MMNSSNKNMLSAGQLLRNRRLDLKIPIQTAAEETKIQKKYLEMMENDRFSDFESETFLRGFLRNYAIYLGLKPDKLLAIYRRDMKVAPRDESIKLQKPVEKKRISPKAVGEIILLSFVFVVIIYFGYQLYNFQKVPELNIYTPEDNITVNTESIMIQGETDSNTIVTINDLSVELDENGLFEETIALVAGVNTINIRAVRDNNESKESAKVLTITREEEEMEEKPAEEEEEVVEVFDKLILKVVGGEAWIQLFIDEQQELGQIVPNGFEQEYTVKESVEMTTGRYSITQVYINGESKPVGLKLVEGVGVLSCTLENNLLNCDN